MSAVHIQGVQHNADGSYDIYLGPKATTGKEGKPLGIQKFIGRRPIAAFGNSDGDLQMLQWTAGGTGKRLMVLVHHTDSQREWVYDRQSNIGRLDKALDEAVANSWTVIDMKNDWKRMFPLSP